MDLNARGSQWRKWDLHIHTPFTKLNNQYKPVHSDDVWKEYCDKLEASDVQVFGITDYFISDNYFVFLDSHKKHYPDSAKKFFLNIEFRLSVSVNKRAEEVNIHIIFSDKVARVKIEEFLMKLNTNITKHGVAVACRHLSSKSEFESAAVEYNKIVEKLRDVFGSEKCYIIVAASNNSGLRPDSASPRKLIQTDEIDKISDAFFGGMQNTEYYLKVDRYENDQVSKPKPVVGGSDAHSFEDIDNFLGKQVIKNSQGRDETIKDITWIKAEPSFEGLLQILNEPTRAFIGEQPPIIKRVNTHSTKYIKSLNIKKIDDSPLKDLWFNDLKIEFNPELVAIIGNKGKGKSALADILGLVANAHIDENDFSFLHKTKFRNPRPNLAKEFIATLAWEGGGADVKNLDSLPNTDAPERVKYIPQSFLEKLCTSIDKKVFEEELEKVIFSRLEDHQKLGKGSLREVLNEKRSFLDGEISRIKTEISFQNTSIIELERKNSFQYRNSIEESLQSKRNELFVHDQNKPIEKKPPNQTEENKKKTEEISKKITEQREVIRLQIELREQLNSERTKLALEVNELTKLRQTLNALSENLSRSVSSLQALLQKYQLTESSLVNYSITVAPIDSLLKRRGDRQKEIESILSNVNTQNPEKLISVAVGEIKKLQDELEVQDREYQKYLTELQEWQKLRDEIVGTSDQEGSLVYFESVKNYLGSKIQIELISIYGVREELVKQLISTKQATANLYRELYGPVSEFITLNKNELSDYNVNIDVELEVVGFPDKFFNYVSNGAAGSFYGSGESRQLLAKITDVVNFNEPDSVINWLRNIMAHLHQDKREENGPKRDLRTQLKGGFKEKEFYDFLFSLDYYEPNYQLKLGEKSLSELSPGERGALLLIFYLLLDKRDIPMIIDQPEENLDNQSVYKILVHFIKKAKSKRQIIIVTHNPNLAVVCDAEQVIRMDIAKDNGNLVSLITGGIENPIVNRAIVDVLEGTRPAFDNRTDKYLISR